MKTSDIKNKILEGSKIAIKKLVDRKRRENSYLIVSDQGKVVKIQATDIKLWRTTTTNIFCPVTVFAANLIYIG